MSNVRPDRAAPRDTRPQSRRVVVTGHGGPEVLQVEEAPVPAPGPGEARLRVVAAGVSAFDLIYRRWARLPGRPPEPFVLGEDVVGVVEAHGAGVAWPPVGQLVAAATWSLGVGGGYAEHVCLPTTDLVRVPDGVDPVEAVCLVVNYLTAHHHLHRIGQLVAGERVLVHGAAGGVGTAAVQLAVLAGAEVYGTASTSHLDVVADQGATPIDYRTEDFLQRIRALTGDGVDVVVDTVGGAGHLWRSRRALRRGGRLVWLGSAAVEERGLRVGPLSILTTFGLRVLPDGRRVPRCPTTGQVAAADPRWYRETLTELLDLLAAGELHPVVGERLPLEDAARAHDLLEHHATTGKLVLVTSAAPLSTGP